MRANVMHTAEAEDGAAAAGGEQQQQVVQPAPVVKKAKMVVAKAKPQIFSPQVLTD